MGDSRILSGFIDHIKRRSEMVRVLVLILCFVFLAVPVMEASAADTAVNIWYPPSWKTKPEQAKSISEAIGSKSGYDVKPRIAQSYPQILSAFAAEGNNLVYVGSFVQAIISSRKLGTTLVQAVNGKEMYSGIMVYPKGADPKAIINDSPDQIAFTVGASSGESSAKAATGGKASMGVTNHMAASKAVAAGKAKAAVVKNWWWEGNKSQFAGFEVYRIPGVSEEKNPDNVLTASKQVPAEVAEKIRQAAIASAAVFGAKEMRSFDEKDLEFTLGLMKKGGIDPLTYTW